MMICALPVQPLLTLLQFSWMTKTVLLLCFNMPNKSALAHTLYKMKVRRARLLGLTLGI
jgi:hypothetical protein